MSSAGSFAGLGFSLLIATQGPQLKLDSLKHWLGRLGYSLIVH